MRITTIETEILNHQRFRAQWRIKTGIREITSNAFEVGASNGEKKRIFCMEFCSMLYDDLHRYPEIEEAKQK